MEKSDIVKRLIGIEEELKKGKGDREAAHGEAESMLLEFLEHNGHKDLADAYISASQHFWCA